MGWDWLSGTLFGGQATPWLIQKPILRNPNAVGKCEWRLASSRYLAHPLQKQAALAACGAHEYTPPAL